MYLCICGCEHRHVTAGRYLAGAVRSPGTGVTLVVRPGTWVLGTELGTSLTSLGMLLTAEPSPQFLSTAFLTDATETASLLCGQRHFLLRLGDFNLSKSHFQYISLFLPWDIAQGSVGPGALLVPGGLRDCSVRYSRQPLEGDESPR